VVGDGLGCTCAVLLAERIATATTFQIVHQVLVLINTAAPRVFQHILTEANRGHGPRKFLKEYPIINAFCEAC